MSTNVILQDSAKAAFLIWPNFSTPTPKSDQQLNFGGIFTMMSPVDHGSCAYKWFWSHSETISLLC